MIVLKNFQNNRLQNKNTKSIVLEDKKRIGAREDLAVMGEIFPKINPALNSKEAFIKNPNPKKRYILWANIKNLIKNIIAHK